MLCQVPASASQGWKALALGRCRFIFCLNPTSPALLSMVTSLPPLVVKARRTFLHSTCHGKGRTKTPARVKRGGFDSALEQRQRARPALRSRQLGLLRPARMPCADGHTLPWASQEAASTWERSKAVKKELFKPQA